MYMEGWLCFLTLEKQPSVVMFYVSQQHTPLSSPKGQGPAGPRVGSDLRLRTCSTGYRLVVFLLLVSAPWWVRLV